MSRLAMAQLRAFAAGLGWRVQHRDLVADYGEEERDTNGGVIRKTRKIVIATHKPLTPQKELMVLLHEIGHVLAYQRGYVAEPEQIAEDRAMLYGWAARCKLGLTVPTKKTWRRFHYNPPQRRGVSKFLTPAQSVPVS